MRKTVGGEWELVNKKRLSIKKLKQAQPITNIITYFI